MDAETKVVVDRIDGRIRELRQLRDKLIEEFGTEAATRSANHVPKKRGKKATRKGEVIKSLKANGPLSTRELHEKTNIPTGTLGWLLRDKDTFSRSKEGKWSLKERNEAV
jgi:hypothetical protein